LLRGRDNGTRNSGAQGDSRQHEDPRNAGPKGLCLKHRILSLQIKEDGYQASQQGP